MSPLSFICCTADSLGSVCVVFAALWEVAQVLWLDVVGGCGGIFWRCFL